MGGGHRGGVRPGSTARRFPARFRYRSSREACGIRDHRREISGAVLVYAGDRGGAVDAASVETAGSIVSDRLCPGGGDEQLCEVECRAVSAIQTGADG